MHKNCIYNYKLDLTQQQICKHSTKNLPYKRGFLKVQQLKTDI